MTHPQWRGTHLLCIWRKGGKWGGGQLLRWLRRVGASKKNNEGRGPLRGERMGEKERGVGGSYGGGVSRGASQASSGAEWAVWDVWDSGGRAEHRVGTFVCTMERCIVNGEKKGGLGWLAGERDRRCGGFKQTCRGVRKAWWEKKGSGPLKILGADEVPAVGQCGNGGHGRIRRGHGATG